jgi:hypothetical protein
VRPLRRVLLTVRKKQALAGSVQQEEEAVTT